MTTEERQNFDAFQRKLQESPANRLGFFASVEGIEKPQPANNPFDKWKRDAEYENQAICKHLGIEYHKRILQYQTRNWPVTGHRDCQTHNIR